MTDSLFLEAWGHFFFLILNAHYTEIIFFPPTKYIFKNLILENQKRAQNVFLVPNWWNNFSFLFIQMWK